VINLLVDFGYVDENGTTIYGMCFEQYIGARWTLKKPKAEWKEVITKTEEVFDLLVAEGRKRGFDVDTILEIPDSTGETCFSVASSCSKKICQYIIGRGIKVNSIRTDMMIPDFEYSDLAIQMMKEGINPHVIDYNGNSGVDLYPSCFESDEAKQLLAEFPRSVHFATEDIDCEKSCPENCSSNYKKFFFKNGELVKMTEENRIGAGGFGMVFKEFFHGKLMAMKCMLLGKIESRDYVNETKSDLEKNISELRIQVATAGSGVIVPVAFVRQQNQEKDKNGKWIAKNYNIFIYPLYDCNLYELLFDNFTEEIVGDIIHQCFTRKGS